MKFTHIVVLNGRKRGVFLDPSKVISYIQDFTNPHVLVCSSREEAMEIFKNGRPKMNLKFGIVDENPEFPPIW